MTAVHEWFASLIVQLPYAFLVPYLGAVFGGEETILIISVLAAGGAFSFPLLFAMSFLGTVTSDIAWFYFGKYGMRWLEGRPSIYEKIEQVEQFTVRMTRGQDFLALLITKFLYGTRLIMIFYLARKRLSFRAFLAYDAAVTGIWALVICSLGWWAGRGVSWAAQVFGDLSSVLGVMVIGFVALYALRIWLNKTLIETTK